VCPPYDIISSPQAEALRRRSPSNAVNLELAYQDRDVSPDDDRYARTAGLFLKWFDMGVLVRDPSSVMYLLDEQFSFKGAERRRRGLMAIVRLEEFDKAIVMLHEHTTPGPIADRQALLKAARCNFSPLMSLYPDSDGGISRLLDQGQHGAPLLGAHRKDPTDVGCGPLLSRRSNRR